MNGRNVVLRNSCAFFGVAAGFSPRKHANQNREALASGLLTEPGDGHHPNPWNHL